MLLQVAEESLGSFRGCLALSWAACSGWPEQRLEQMGPSGPCQPQAVWESLKAGGFFGL